MSPKEALRAAIESENLEGVRSALALGASPNPPRSAAILRLFGVRFDGPLIRAVWTGKLPIVLELINAGADCDQSGERGLTALALAVDLEMEEIVVVLLDAGAEVNKIMWQSMTALLVASFTGNLRLVKLLLDRGASPSSVMGRDDGSLLRTQGDVLRLLVSAGGVASPGIRCLLESNQALGDYEKRFMNPSSPSSSEAGANLI